MESYKEEELQRLVEEGLSTNRFLPLSEEEIQEVQLYNLLFQILKQEPESGPSLDFSKKITSAINSEIKYRSMLKFYISLGLLFFGCVVGILGVMFSFDSLFNTEFIKMILSMKWIFIFCFICIIIIQLADQKLIQANLSQRHD